jgi:hypothetical protein
VFLPGKKTRILIWKKQSRFLRAAKDHISGDWPVDLRAAGGRAMDQG